MTSRIWTGFPIPGFLPTWLALKPGKPTILGVDKESESVLMGLPGHPGAALVVFRLLAGWLEDRGQAAPKAHGAGGDGE